MKIKVTKTTEEEREVVLPAYRKEYGAIIRIETENQYTSISAKGQDFIVVLKWYNAPGEVSKAIGLEPATEEEWNDALIRFELFSKEFIKANPIIESKKV